MSELVENPEWWGEGEFSANGAGGSYDSTHTYRLGETRDTDELWTTSGLFGTALTDLFGGSWHVTGREALQQAAALICVDVLAQDISKAPLKLRKKLRNGGSKEVLPTEHPIARMLALEPNRRHTWVEFNSMMVYHLVLASNSYAYIQRDRVGDPAALVPIMPLRAQEFINRRSRETFYELQAGTFQEEQLLGTDYLVAPERDVIHIRQRMLDGFWGYSTLTAGGRTLRMGQHLQEYAENTFAEGGIQRGFFSRPADKEAMTDPQFQRARDQIKKALDWARGKREPVLLEDGITYNKVAQNATEAAASEALDAHIEMTCKLWRMPPHKAMHLNAVKYENLTAMEKVYVRDTLIPLCKLAEERLGRMLLTPDERLQMFFEFDRDVMSIFDDKVENERVASMVSRSVISINEARIDQGYNPRPGGDVYMLPVNMVLVDKDGKIVATGVKPAANGETPADGVGDGEDDGNADETKNSPRLVVNNN